MKAKKSGDKKRRHKSWLWLTLCAAVLTGLLLDGRYRLVTTEYQVASPQLPAAFDGFRIVQLSDLHLRQYGRDNARILKQVRELSPDIIVLTGDFLDKFGCQAEGEQALELESFFHELVRLAPCYYVSGNHEWASGELPALESLLEQQGIRYLKNEYLTLERSGESIVLAGVEDPNGMADMIKPPELVARLRQEYPEGFAILLGHRNYWLEKYPQLDVDLIFSGHAHGGIIRLPFAGGIFGTNGELFPQYDKGIFNEGGYDLVISGGLGDSLPLVRLFNNPEIVSVVLKCEK